MKKLTESEIKDKIELLQDWDYCDNALNTDFEFDNFKDCMSAMNRIAFECETLNHHHHSHFPHRQTRLAARWIYPKQYLPHVRADSWFQKDHSHPDCKAASRCPEKPAQTPKP